MTSTPPATWGSERRSPRSAAARSTVTTGSSVLSSDDRAAPIRGRPARNNEIATMVGISAMAKPTAQPQRHAQKAQPQSNPVPDRDGAAEKEPPCHHDEARVDVRDQHAERRGQ